MRSDDTYDMLESISNTYYIDGPKMFAKSHSKNWVSACILAGPRVKYLLIFT